MIADEFYRRDDVKGIELIEILPERRTDSGRIGKQSIMKWVRMVGTSHNNRCKLGLKKESQVERKVNTGATALSRKKYEFYPIYF